MKENSEINNNFLRKIKYQQYSHFNENIVLYLSNVIRKCLKMFFILIDIQDDFINIYSNCFFYLSYEFLIISMLSIGLL